jgi:hypothetical protein
VIFISILPCVALNKKSQNRIIYTTRYDQIAPSNREQLPSLPDWPPFESALPYKICFLDLVRRIVRFFEFAVGFLMHDPVISNLLPESRPDGKASVAGCPPGARDKPEAAAEHSEASTERVRI